MKRFWDKVDKTDTCWLWKGRIKKDGYGQFDLGGKSIYAHRVAYELEVGDIPKGLNLDHLCRVRNCVNPNHLEAVTFRENVLRGIGICAHNARKTHCKQGHTFTIENTILRSWGGRECRTCKKANRQRYNELKKKVG